MRVAFVQPELRRFDLVKSDAFALCLHPEDWPLRGTAGLVDWRVCGHLSRLRESGWITCEPGEIVLMPLTRRLPCDKLLVIGMGSVDHEDADARMEAGLHQMFEALERMKVFASIVHLPGRPLHRAPEKAMDVLLDVAEAHPDHDEVVVVEPVEAQQIMRRVYEGRFGVQSEILG